MFCFYTDIYKVVKMYCEHCKTAIYNFDNNELSKKKMSSELILI